MQESWCASSQESGGRLATPLGIDCLDHARCELLDLNGGDGAVVGSLLRGVLGVGGNLLDGGLGATPSSLMAKTSGQVPSHMPQPMQSSLTVAFMVNPLSMLGPSTQVPYLFVHVWRRGRNSFCTCPQKRAAGRELGVYSHL